MTGEQRIKYVESYPNKIDKTFESMGDYRTFYDKRFNEVTEKLELFIPNSRYHYYDWKHSSVKLNKNGEPRKYFNPTHLHTKKARAKQTIKFREYQEKRKKESQLKKQQKEQLDTGTYKSAIDLLLKNKIDLNRLDIKIKK